MHEEHAPPVEARLDPAQLPQASQQQARTREQHQGGGNLRDENGHPRRRPPARGDLARAFDRRVGLHPGKPKRRKQARGQARKGRHAERDREDAPVQPEVDDGGGIERGQPDEQVVQSECDCQSAGPTEHGQERALSQQLLDDACASRAQAEAHRHLRTAALWHSVTDKDLIWVVSDTGWAKSAWGLYGQWVQGAALFVHHAEGRFNARLTLELLTKKGVTVFCGPPTVYRMLILEDLSKYDYSGLRHCTSAGEPLNPEVIKVWKAATGRTIYEGYGQTETTVLVANYPFMPVKPGSMGKPVPDLTIDILDEDFKPAPAGEVGYICVKANAARPVGIFEGYLEDDEENAKVFRHGWYNTGDKAIKDSDGYFTFVGRGDDIIKASGYRIGPFEVESVIQEHPAVAENAVVASPDPVRGEIVKAFIVLKPGHKPSEALVTEVQEFVKARTAPYKYPREIEFMDELPKTVSGKIRRAALRSREVERKLGKGGLGGQRV